jgi:hypothetical protein
MSKKITFKDVAPMYIYTSGRGWEVSLVDGNIPSGELSGRGITIEEKTSARQYLKGLRWIFNRAKQVNAFDDVMGNYGNIEEKYYAIKKGMTREYIQATGRGEFPTLTFYIDGSVGSYINPRQIR